MAMKKGTSAQVVSDNVREMMRSGRPQKESIAAALAMKRKYKHMADGGMVEEEDHRDLGELAIDGEDAVAVANPASMEHERMMAEALHKKAEEEEMEGYAMGGLVEEEDTALGTKPSEDMASSKEEPMPSMMSEDAMRAIKEKKAKRRFS